MTLISPTEQVDRVTDDVSSLIIYGQLTYCFRHIVNLFCLIYMSFTTRRPTIKNWCKRARKERVIRVKGRVMCVIRKE